MLPFLTALNENPLAGVTPHKPRKEQRLPCKKVVGPFISLKSYETSKPEGPGLAYREVDVVEVTISTHFVGPEGLRHNARLYARKDLRVAAMFEQALIDLYRTRDDGVIGPNMKEANYRKALDIRRKLACYSELGDNHSLTLELDEPTALMLASRNQKFLRGVADQTEYLLAGLQAPDAEYSGHWQYANALNKFIRREVRAHHPSVRWIDSASQFSTNAEPNRANPLRKQRGQPQP